MRKNPCITVQKTTKNRVLLCKKGQKTVYYCANFLYENRRLQYNYNSNYNVGEGLSVPFAPSLKKEKKEINSLLAFSCCKAGTCKAKKFSPHTHGCLK
jgi:hypothetical protein